MIRLRRWLFLLFALSAAVPEALADKPTLGPFEEPRPRALKAPHGDEAFDVEEALHGAFSSAEQCAAIDGAFWVEADGDGECIRTYSHGLGRGSNPVVLVYLAGDVMLHTTYGVRYIGASYPTTSPAQLTAAMAGWSDDAGVPAIYLARPGTYGSSGDHNLRRHPREVLLVDAALDAIKLRHQVGTFIVAGQSGGAHVAASLLNKRHDISAAVLASGILSARRVAALWDKRRKVPGSLLYKANELYDPIDEVEQISNSPQPRIYVLSDPEDRVVPFATQLQYVRLLRASGYAPQHVYLHAPDRQRHGLAVHAKLAAALLAKSKPDREIRKTLSELELQQFQ